MKVSAFRRWQEQRRQAEISAVLTGTSYLDDDEGRYVMWCPREYQSCSWKRPCTPEQMEYGWDMHLGHIEHHCDYRTCRECCVITNW